MIEKEARTHGCMYGFTHSLTHSCIKDLTYRQKFEGIVRARYVVEGPARWNDVGVRPKCSSRRSETAQLEMTPGVSKLPDGEESRSGNPKGERCDPMKSERRQTASRTSEVPPCRVVQQFSARVPCKRAGIYRKGKRKMEREERRVGEGCW